VRGFVGHPMFSRIMNAEEKKKAHEAEMETNFHKVHEGNNLEVTSEDENDKTPKLSLKEILQEIETEKRNLK
jgi:hypothetical protein